MASMSFNLGKNQSYARERRAERCADHPRGFTTCKIAPTVPCPVLGPPVQDRHGHTGLIPAEDTEMVESWGQAEKTGFDQPQKGRG